MQFRLKGRNPFALFFVRTQREQYLVQYVLREYARGRSIQDIVDDPYVINRSTAEQRARLLEHPELVAAIGEQTIADLKRGVAAAPGAT